MSVVNSETNGTLNHDTLNHDISHDTSDLERLYNLKAERATLGAIFRDAKMLDDVRSIVSPTDFFQDAHQRIFAQMLRAERSVDVITVGKFLTDAGQLQDIGGYPYLTSLHDESPTSINAPYYARIVHQHSLQRQLLEGAKEIQREAENPSNPEHLQEWAEERILRVRDNLPSETRPLNFYLSQTLDELDSFATGKTISLISGLKKFDEFISLAPGRFIVIAARPGVGKSLLGDQIPLMLAAQGHPCVIYSLEMAGEEIASRYIANLAGLPVDYLQRRRMAYTGEVEIAIETISGMKKYPLFINETPWQTIYGIGADIRKLKRKHDIRLAAIDYLQLIHSHRGRQQRYEQLGEISRHIKNLAKELQIPFLVSVQLNRDSEKAADGRPKLSQMRESGNIEQDADTALLMWPDAQDETIIHGEVAKNRNGPKGYMEFRHIKHHMRFEDL